MSVKPIIHEIRIQNQVIFLDPPIEYARQSWVRQLHDWIGEVEEYKTRCAKETNWTPRRCLPTAPNPKFEIRDRVADAERHGIGNDLYFIGMGWWLGFPFFLGLTPHSLCSLRIIPSNTRLR